VRCRPSPSTSPSRSTGASGWRLDPRGTPGPDYKDSKVIITVWVDEDILNISVQDFGTGISEKNQKVIFERFKRLDSGINSINRGHGLGLSITKALLDVMGGNIEIESKKGEGSTFFVRIPEAKNIVEGFSGEGNETFFDGDDEIF
jgi:signal transduction histidine kinase